MAQHRAGWKFIRPDRFATLEKKFKAITRIPARQALEKYISHRSEVELLHSAIGAPQALLIKGLKKASNTCGK